MLESLAAFDSPVDPLSTLDSLANQFPTIPQKLVVTGLMIALLVAVVLFSRRLQSWLNERVRPLYSDVVTTCLLVATLVVSVSVCLGVWEQAATVQEAYYGELGLGRESIPRLVSTAVILLSTYILTRFVRRVLREVFGSSGAVTEHQRKVTHRVSQVVIWTAALIVVLGLWEVDLSGLLIGAGFLGIVLGMAARQTLGALLAGFVLMFARPFEIGDWVEIDGREGIVTDISIVDTRIQTFDGEYLMFPNDVVGSSVVTNRSKKGRLRLEVEVGVDYETDVKRAAELAEEAIEEVDEAMSVPSPRTVSKEFGDSAIVLGVRFWIDKPSARRRWSARTAAIGAIKEAFQREGIKIPFPQQELSGRAETGGFRVADADGVAAPDDREAESEPERERAPGEGRGQGATPEDD